MRAILRLFGCFPFLWLLVPGQLLPAQTIKEMESHLQVSRGVHPVGEPVLSLFSVLFLASVLLVIATIVLGLRATASTREEAVHEEVTGEEESYFLHIAFLAVGYVAIIIMLAYLPPALTPGLGSATKWILLVAGIFISVAHILAARDEQALPRYLKYLFSGSVVLAAFFFHLAFKQWSFLQFSDPFYSGKMPYVALGLIILLVLAYSAYITWKHCPRPRRRRW